MLLDCVEIQQWYRSPLGTQIGYVSASGLQRWPLASNISPENSKRRMAISIENKR